MGKLGIKSKLYRNTGTHDGPAWSEVTCILNLSVKAAWEKSGADSRASRIKKSMKTMLPLTFTGKMKCKPGDTNYEAISDAAVSDEVVDMLILNGPLDEAGVRGWRCDVQVFDISEDQGEGVVLYEDISFEPTDSDHEPMAVLVDEGGGLTFAVPGEATASFS